MGTGSNQVWRSGLFSLGFGLALWCEGLVGVADATATITEFALPAASGRPVGIAAGPDGALWFTRMGGNQIGRITTAGTITTFGLPAIDGGFPFAITAGPDGALWFTEIRGNKIGRITTAGTITEFPLPAGGGDPGGITTGQDGALWFIDGNRIGRITTAGAITEFAIPTGGGGQSITAGPDGALWFTNESLSMIGRITPDGAITEFRLPTASQPAGIAAGPDGALWFTEINANKIGRIVPDPDLVVGTAAVSLSGSLFHMDQTIIYEATLAPGPKVTPVDIYLGALMPDGVTFLSLVQGSSGAISIALGPSAIPFQANVLLYRSVIPLSYRFAGFEPAGTYVAYARLAIAGSNPLVPENQLSLAVRSFQFSSDVCLSLSVSGSGSVASNPQGNGGPGCFAYFAQGTTVTLTAQTQNSTFAGWSGDCASAGTYATCTLVMTTNKHIGASFSTAGPGGRYISGYECIFGLCHIKLQFNPRIRLF